ncbi:MAG: single-stranded DNA-binding protein [Oscillospiraceae bacterium]|nr:single-stranded DNA-binding protein [Oscillospiraceae bacterium]
MEQTTVNHITLVGNLASAPAFSHGNHGRRFYSFYLEVARLSGAIDRLQILASEDVLYQTQVQEGDALLIEGQIRSFNNRAPSGRRLIISVLAETMEVTDAPHDNRVQLQGIICKDPVYRRTPLGREICDVMLAVNRPYHRADYLPCILWGRCAQEVAAYPVGTPLFLTGRLQSRAYIKVTDGVAEERTAYEISAITAELAQLP